MAKRLDVRTVAVKRFLCTASAWSVSQRSGRVTSGWCFVTNYFCLGMESGGQRQSGLCNWR